MKGTSNNGAPVREPATPSAAAQKAPYEAPRVLKKQALTRVTLASTFGGGNGSFTGNG